MRTRSSARASCAATATVLGITAFGAGSALADPIPPAHFTYDVFSGRTLLPDCMQDASAGGSCGSEASIPGYAATSGGIGTGCYLPVTPGGTVLGTGTAVDAMSTSAFGEWVQSNAEMTYSFRATGPAGDSLIPIDVLSTGLISSSGDASAHLSLTVSGPGAGDLLDLSASCSDETCTSDWGTPGHELTDGLCIGNGDIYTITIDAGTAAGARQGALGGASAVLDPRIIFDPPSVPSCTLIGSLSEYTLQTSAGTSTGHAVPEPSALSLAAIGVLGFGWLGFGRVRQSRV